jgi:3-hydroxyacyl-CoA dehydrogenase
MMGLLNPTLDFDALADCDLIIEAVFEQMEIKKDIFGRLDKIAKPARSSPATPATSTSTRSPPPPAARRTWSGCTSSRPPTS